MKFTVKLWRFTLTLSLLDIDLSDGDIELSLKVAWK